MSTLVLTRSPAVNLSHLYWARARSIIQRYSLQGNETATFRSTAIFDDQVKDRMNLGLSENVVSLITVILTGLSMLLLLEISLRLVVREKHGQVNKLAVYRKHLMIMTTNPFAWFNHGQDSCEAEMEMETGPFVTPCANEENREKAQMSYPIWKSTCIRAIAVLLILAEVGLIFLATGRNTKYPIDVTRIPTFEVEDRGIERGVPPNNDGCTNEPLTAKPGFNSRARLLVCISVHAYNAEPFDGETLSTDQAQVVLTLGRDSHQIEVHCQGRTLYIRQFVAISIGNGTLYVSDSTATGPQARTAMDSLFERVGILTLRRSSSLNSREFIETSVVQVPSGFPYSQDSTLIQGALALLIRRLFHMTGLSRGRFTDEASEVRFLDEVEDALLINNRPWLGVIPSVVVCLVLFFIWLILKFILKWEGGKDDRWAWKEFFSDTKTIYCFPTGRDETVYLAWGVDHKTGSRFGYFPRGLEV